MSATQTKPNLQYANVAGTTGGYLGFADPTGFIKGARAWLRDSSNANPQECFITVVDLLNRRVGLVFTSSLPENYGRTDLSAYGVGSSLDQEAPGLSNWVSPQADGGRSVGASITISPGSATTKGTNVTFKATVNGFTDTVVWSLLGTALGSITSGGVYTPGVMGTDIVVAQSSTYPWIKAYAAVTRLPQLSILARPPTTAQIAAGSLLADDGVTVVSCSRAAAAYCRNVAGGLTLIPAGHIRVESPGILVEGSTTNNVLYSNDFSNGSVWTLNGVTVAQNVVGPDGLANTGWTVTMATGGLQSHRLFQASSSLNRRLSIYAKLGTGAARYIGLYSGGAHTSTNQAAWDLTDGSLAGTYNTPSPMSEALGNGWFRFSIIGDGNYCIPVFGNTAQQALGDNTWSSAGGDTVLIAFCQNEDRPFLTSYIPTLGLAVTRDADVVTVPNPLDPSNPVAWRAGVSVNWPSSQTSSLGENPLFLGTGGYGGPFDWDLYAQQVGGTPSTAIDVAFDSVGGTFNITPADTIPDNTWTALLGTNNAGAMEFFINGVSKGTATGGLISTQKSTLTLGGWVYGYLNGYVRAIFVDNS
jgi:hypothetical protein